MVFQVPGAQFQKNAAWAMVVVVVVVVVVVMVSSCELFSLHTTVVTLIEDSCHTD